jgi:hypothetical protein
LIARGNYVAFRHTEDRTMAYFDPTEDSFMRAGKLIGDVLAALTYLSVIALMLVPLLR